MNFAIYAATMLKLRLLYAVTVLPMLLRAEAEEHFRHLLAAVMAIAMALGCWYQWNAPAPVAEVMAARRQAEVAAAAAVELDRESVRCIPGRNIGADPEALAAERRAEAEDPARENSLCVSGRNAR